MKQKYFNPNEKTNINFVSLASAVLHFLSLFIVGFVGGFSIIKLKDLFDTVGKLSMNYDVRKLLGIYSSVFILTVVYSAVVYFISSFKQIKALRLIASIISIANVVLWGAIVGCNDDPYIKLGFGYFILLIATIAGLVSIKFDKEVVDSAVGLINKETGEWRCHVCDGKNSANNTRCSKCGTDRK